VKVLALEHWRSDAFSLFGELLAEKGILVDRVLVSSVDHLPDWREYDLLIAMGGPMGVYEEVEYPWLVGEKRTIREAVKAGTPFFGVCFGAQLLASSLGAEVYRGPAPELGLSPIFLTESARRDPVFRGFPRDLEVFEWHQDAFDLPQGALCLARSPRYANQAMRVGRVAYGIQCHFEKSAEDVGRSLEAKPALLDDLEKRYGKGSVERFLEVYAALVPSLQETARQILRRWLELSGAVGGAVPARALVPIEPLSEPLIARREEQKRIDGILEEARTGGNPALVIRGAAGIGKTSLLDLAIKHADGLQVLQTVGVDADSERPFAALEELCGPLLGLVHRLQPAQGEALAAALELRETAPLGDRFAVYSAFFALLEAAAQGSPILVAVDDAHWMDEASTEALAFVVRRGAPARTAFLFAVDGESFAIDGATELTLGRLDDVSLRCVLERQKLAVLEDAVASRVVESAAGNPLAVLELPLALTPAQQGGLEEADLVLHARATGEEAFLHRILRLTEEQRLVLLLAALDEDAALETLGRACGELGIDASAFSAAEAEGLLRIGKTKIEFRHPVVRSAAAYAAPIEDRRVAHKALALSLIGPSAADRRAWHLARAASAPDELSATALAEAAGRARARRAHGTAARAFELAARLTPDSEVRAERLLSAAEAAHLAGHVSAALDYLDAARASVPGEAILVDVEHLRGRVAARMGSAAIARDVLVAAADRCELQDPRSAALMLADAVIPCLRSGRPEEALTLGRRALDLAEHTDVEPRIRSRLMLGTALIFTGRFEAGRDLVSAAADLAESFADVTGELQTYLGRSLRLAGYHDRAAVVLEEQVIRARSEGSLGLLSYALTRLADLELECGRWTTAASELDEAIRLARETGQSADEGLALGTLGWLNAAQGRDDDCRSNVAAALGIAERLGTGSQLDRAGLALGLLELGNERPRAAIRHLERVVRQQHEQGWSDAAVTPHVSPDLIEAYALDGRHGKASELLMAFEADAKRAGRISALAAIARCRGLLDQGDEAERWFACSLEHAPTDVSTFERARTQLSYAERLNKHGKLEHAQKQSAAALSAFEHLGARPWADRARSEIDHLRANLFV